MSEFLEDGWKPMVVFLAVILLAGGGLWLLSRPVQGIVIEKSIEPSHDTTTVVCNTINKMTICTPITTHTPDQYWLRVNSCKNDKCSKRWADVYEPVYNKYQIGDRFDSEHIK